MTRLLIMGCSATKRPDPGLLPARERYHGPLWQTLRAADPAGSRAQLVFLSARYGFAAGDLPIEDYEARMTPAQAQAMIAAGAELPAGLVRGPVAEVALVGGRVYLDVMRAALARLPLAAGATVTVINAPIGYMRAQLRAWLAAGQEQKERACAPD